MVEFCRSPKYWFAIKNSVDSVPFLEAVAPHLLIPVIPPLKPCVNVYPVPQREGYSVTAQEQKMLNPLYTFNSYLLLCLVTRCIINILCLYLLFS